MQSRSLHNHRLGKFLALPPSERALFLQAWCLLGWARAAILLRPFKRIVRKLQHHPEAITPLPVAPEQQETAQRIGYLVAAAARYTPWQSLCLAQVLVAQRLLAARQIPGQFFLGVRKGEAKDIDGAELAAHAWLSCEDTVVIGEAGHETFAVVSAFSWGGELA
jgi:hypothetical protein